MSLALRSVEPEILDALAAEDPRAVASRRDLRRLNALMLQRGIVASLLARHVGTPPRRILEVGAGDGTFLLAVARRLARRWAGVEVVLLDRRPVVARATLDEFARLGWRAEVATADVFDWAGGAGAGRFDAVTANLFLHHFREPELARLLAALSRLAPAVLAAEPARAAFPLLASRLLWAIGANDVTRNDAPASVRAGFSGREISALWPQGQGWTLEEGRRGLFTHVFAATGGAR